MNIIIRQEKIGELPIILDLVKAAFANVYESDHQEQFLVRRLHQSETFIPQLSLVAVTDSGTIVGYILLTEVEIISETSVTTSLAVAPLAVHPNCQKQGIGGKLLDSAHKIAASLGYGTAVLLGHKDYYPRFGYRQATDYDIDFPFNAPKECCMVVELLPEALNKTVKGIVHYPDCFQTTSAL